MSFRPFAHAPVADLIEQAATSAKLTLLVGAGASMEAGLPSWEQLLEKLLLRAALERGVLDIGDDRARERWVLEGRRDGYLGAAALVDALAGTDRDAWLKHELYEPKAGAEAYYPGPISREIARLADAYESDLRILTLNYDDLIEQALRDYSGAMAHAIATEDHQVPAGAVPVYHLHGYLGRDGRPSGELVLSEADYQRMQLTSSWQEALVRTAFMDSAFVFVGTSLLDPNMIRYLHLAGTGTAAPRFAIFVRQGTYPADVPAGIPPAREDALRARWEAVGVTPVFLNHYVDVAQALYEIGRRRSLGDDYQSLPERTADWIGTVEQAVLGWHDDAAFERGQRVVNQLLASALSQAVATAGKLEGTDWTEVLQLALWLVDAHGERVTIWVTTDRVHVDRRTVEPIEIDDHSRWLAVRSYCLGAPLAESRSVYASRWSFVRGTPLVLESPRHGRLPVGCLTTASLEGRDTTRLGKMEGDVERAFNAALSDAVLTLLDQPFVSS